MKSKTNKKIKPAEHLRCVLGILCSNSVIDQELNNISVFNVIDQFTVLAVDFNKIDGDIKFLNVPVPHEIVLVWRLTLPPNLLLQNPAKEIKLSIIDPTGMPITEHLLSMVVPKGVRRYRFRIRLAGIKVSMPGDYCYRVEVLRSDSGKFMLEHEIPFEVEKKI